MSQPASQQPGGRRGVKRKAYGAYNKAIRSRRGAMFRSIRQIARPMHFPSYFGDQPPRKFAKLKYCKHFLNNGIGAGAISAYEFRANGLYDPEVAIGGHQPYGFDQLMAQYSHFTVINSKCTLEYESNMVNSNQQWQIMLYNDTGVAAAAFAAGAYNALSELPVVSKTLMAVDSSGANERARCATLYCDMAKISGKSKFALIGDKDYSGDAGNDPTDQSFFAVVGTNPDGSASATQTLFKVTLVYMAVFTEPRFFTPS